MANWYDTDPDKAQEVLGQINRKRRETGQADLSASEMDQAKQSLAGETFDQSKLNSVLDYIGGNAQTVTNNGDGKAIPWVDPIDPNKQYPIDPGGKANPWVDPNGGMGGGTGGWSEPGPMTPPPPPSIPGPIINEPVPPESAPTLPSTPRSPEPTLTAPPTSATRIADGIPELGGQGGEMFRFLMDRARQRLDVGATDPTIRGQVDAVRAEQTRNARQYLSGLAESAGPNANIGAETRSANEKVGQNTSAFQAGLIAQEISARRTEIQNALNGAQGLLTSQQQMQLQEELASLDNAERQYEFQANQSESTRQFDVSTDIGKQQFLASLMNNRDQFGRTLAQRGYEFDTGQANDLLKNTRSLSLQEALAQLALSQRAYEFDTTERRLNSPLG